jgi:tetratricopeptide (TPR) repeat protein
MAFPRGIMIRISVRTILGAAIVSAASATLFVPAALATDKTIILAQQNQQGGQVLQLPGLPPIKLPPGTQVYGPNGQGTAPAPPARPGAAGREGQTKEGQVREDEALERSRSRAATPEADKQKGKTTTAKKKPVGRDAVLTDLFNRLAKAKTRTEARGIVSSIEQTWLQSGSDTADLLMRRALQAMKKQNHKLALELLNKVVFLEPNWSEVWNQRATARYYADDPDGAVADVAQTLAREPRHFAALVGLGFILRRANQEKMALKVFRRALEINPQLTNIKSIIEKLEISVEGQGI